MFNRAISDSDFSKEITNSSADFFLFCFGVFFIDFALVPNLNVDRDSSKLYSLGEQLMTNVVFEFPPFFLK
jgi:hypothetical protein